MSDPAVPESSAGKQAAAGKAAAAPDGGKAAAAGRQPWTRPDRINLVGVIIALAAFAGGVGVPGIISWYHEHFQEPGAAIVTAADG